MNLKLTQQGYEKLNNLNIKYNIFCYDLSNEDIWDCIIRLKALNISEKEAEFVNKLHYLFSNYANNY